MLMYICLAKHVEAAKLADRWRGRDLVQKKGGSREP